MIRIAVLAFRGSARALQRWQATADHLAGAIPGRRFELRPLSLDALDRAVIDGSVDFAITNAGQYVRLGARHGLRPLATLRAARHPEREAVIGSALLVRDEAPYRSLAELRHATLGAVDPLAFGGYQAYLGELESRGLTAEGHFGAIRYSGFPVEALAYWVRDGQVDAAVVPACLLEQLGEEGLVDPARFRVIEPRAEPDFGCATSSALYPNWSFSALRHTPPPLAEAVARALLAMPGSSTAARDAGALGWTVPASNRAVHTLFERLAIHPWQEPWWLGLARWTRHNAAWAAALLLAMLAGFGHHLWVQLKVGRRSRQLQAANDQLLHRQQELAHAQRVATLGELASGLAHELNQPLAAIHCFAEGGLVRREHAPREELAALLERVRGEAQRGAAIIARMRDFARADTPPRQAVDVGGLIDETAELLDHDLRRGAVQLRVDHPAEPLRVHADPVALQQMLVNLMRNAIEAMADTQTRQLAIAGRPAAGGAVVTVEDTGTGIDPAEAERLFEPFRSTKPDGLGLGLSISRRIAAEQGGTITLQRTAGGGTRVTCTLPGNGHE